MENTKVIINNNVQENKNVLVETASAFEELITRHFYENGKEKEAFKEAERNLVEALVLADLNNVQRSALIRSLILYVSQAIAIAYTGGIKDKEDFAVLLADLTGGYYDTIPDVLEGNTFDISLILSALDKLI